MNSDFFITMSVFSFYSELQLPYEMQNNFAMGIALNIRTGWTGLN